uniref:Uncharacterized protein n=1 Tax=uncultured prokaryote AT3 TaxID=672202 RepID=D3W8E6_9ZZZZ|nr:hypothetical protein [uncultured prokaryote AT3]
MTWKMKLVAGLVLVLVAAGAIVWLIMPERFMTRVDKKMLEYFGGDCAIEIFSGGQKIRDYQTSGYVLFERSEATASAPAGRHDGVITFKDKQGRNIRVGAWGGTVLVECK